MLDSERRTRMLQLGVKALREFGYPGVNTQNILTDRVYGAFFIGVLENVLIETDNPAGVDYLKGLIDEINTNLGNT